MKHKTKSFTEKTKESFIFIFTMLFFGIMLVIAFFIIIIPRWVLDIVSRKRKK